jgi:Divergent InlB B-repeat domain
VSGGQISCPDTCTQTEKVNPIGFVITAHPDPYSEFDGWGGNCSGHDMSCLVELGVTLRTFRATASFSPLPTAALSVSKSGSGSGTITSSPAGIDCGAVCTQSFTLGTVVSLTAAPDETSTFAGWAGECSGTGACTVTLDADRSVAAAFTAFPKLSVAKAGNGNGTVTSTPSGIDCGTSCSAAFAPGTKVALSAAPDARSLLAGWSGACSGSTSACVVSTAVDTDAAVTFFALPTRTMLLGRRTRVRGCRSAGPLPDRRCSPGAVYADATLQLICTPGYAAKMNVLPAAERNIVYAEYRVPRSRRASFEIDHIVPVEIGGSNAVGNLYAEPGRPAPGFRVKDKLERRLEQLVCARKVPLGAMQRAIATDWVALYRRTFHRAP